MVSFASRLSPPKPASMISQRTLRRALVVIALAALTGGLAAYFRGSPSSAGWIWAAGTVPVVTALAIAITRDLLARRMGVDAIAIISMLAALALRENLAGLVVAIMYAGGNLLEDFAVGRAERDLKALIDRAPRVAHRKSCGAIDDVPIDQVAVGDILLVRAGEVIPIDGLITSASALIDESALTGEPIPVTRRAAETVSSGTINAGETFEMQATARAGDSTYAGILRMVTAAQTVKAPFVRMADRFALVLLPVTLLVAGAAWWFSNDPIRALAVLVAATPCPLILAAPAAFIGGTSQAARRGVLIKGGGPLEALARIQTVMFDKTGTLTVGGARLIAIETAPGTDRDEALRLAASLEQASHHVLAAAIVATARDEGLSLVVPRDVREIQGSGLEGLIDGRKVSIGSLQIVCREGRLEEWARRAARRAAWRSALTVFMSVEGRVNAVFLFADELRRETPRAIQALRRAGVVKTVMVTGDRAEPAETIGAALDLDAVLAERVPSDKVDAVVAERRLAPTLMVGDGINDAPALAAADVGMAMGARGASASSEAADAVILVDRLDRVSEAVAIARRTRGIALQSITAGMALSGATMAAAAFGYVTPIAGALMQEAIDVAVILNALRALSPSSGFDQSPMPEKAAGVLREDHERLEHTLERLHQIADALDNAKSTEAVGYILEANQIVETVIVRHEREDEENVYPRVSDFLKDSHGLSAMSRGHREILHQARLLARLCDGLRPDETEPYLIRDAQRIIESIEALVHIHNVQEEDIYEHATTRFSRKARLANFAKLDGAGNRSATAFEKALARTSKDSWRWLMPASLLTTLAVAGAALYWTGTYDSDVRPGPRAPDHPLERVAATALVSAAKTIPIATATSGVIEAVYCEAGSIVKAGDLCAKVDARPYQLIVEQSRAALAAANRRLAGSKSRLARAQAAYERIQVIGKPSRGQKTIEAARRRLERRQAQAAREERSAELAKTALSLAETSLEQTKIVSPTDGVVVSRSALAGEKVDAARTEPLFTVADIRDVQISLRVAARAANRLRLGEKISFTAGLPPSGRLEGEVTQISRAPAVNGTRDYELVILAPNPGLLLRPGASIPIEFAPKESTRSPAQEK